MTSLIYFNDLVLAAVAFCIFAKVRSSARKQNSSYLSSFSFFYFLLALFFLSSATPLVTSDANLVAVAEMISFGFVFYAGAQMAYLALALDGRPKFARIVFYGTLVYGLFFVLVRLIQFEPSIAEAGSRIYWRPVFAPWLRAITGVVFLFLGSTTVIVFLKNALQHRENAVIYYRSMWISAGVLLESVAAAVSLIFAPTGDYGMVMAANILTVISLFFVLRGITYHSRLPTNFSL